MSVVSRLGRLLRLLALRPLRKRPLRALLAIVAVAAGTSMAVSVFVVRSSVQESVEDFGRTLAGPTELRVVGATRKGGLEADVAERVAATDGVAAAVPVVQAVTLVETAAPANGDAGAADDPDDDGEPVLVLGVDCRAEALVGPFGCSDELVADHGDRPLAVGPGVPTDGRLLTNLGSIPLRDVPVFEPLDQLGEGRFVVFPLASAQRVFARDGRLDAVYVQPEAGTDVAALRAELERVIGEHNGVLSASEGPPEVEIFLSSVLPLFSLLALFALGTGAMLVYNTVTLSLEERRRELAVVSALGGTARMVSATTLGEAGVVGLGGGMLGAAAGVVVAAPIVGTLSSFAERTAGIPMVLHVGFRSLAVGALVGVVVAAGAAAIPIRRALRVDVAGELSQRSLRAEGSTRFVLVRTLRWAALMVAGLTLAWVGQLDGGLQRWQPGIAAVGFTLVTVGLLLTGASLAALAVRPFGRLLGNSPAGRLAVANLVRAAGRTGVMGAAVGAAATTALVTASWTNGVRAAITEDVTDNMDTVAVSSVDAGMNLNLDAGIPPDVLDDLAEVPGVDEVWRNALVLAGSTSDELVSVYAFEDSWILEHDGEEQVRGRVDAAAFERGEAFVNTTLARDTGLRPGDAIALPTPSGLVDVPVQAVTAGGGATGRTVGLPFDLMTEIYGDLPVRSVAVSPEPGLSLDELAERITTSELGDQVEVRTPAEVVADASDGVEAQMAPFWTLQRGLLAVSFVAVLSTLLLVGVQRRQEMGMLLAVGMTPRTLWRMVLAEAALVGVVAVAFSVLGGLIMLWALLDVSPLLIGFVTPFRPDWAAVPLWGAVAILVAVLAALWPARRAARTEVLPALRYD